MDSDLDELRAPLNPVHPDDGSRTLRIIEAGNFDVNGYLEQDIATCRLRIKGMTCTSCAESIENALMMVDGVKRAVVGITIGEAKVLFDSSLINEDRVLEAVDDAGFDVELINSADEGNKVHVKLDEVNFEDMITIRTSLENAVGVNLVEMDFSQQKVTISYEPDQTGPRFLIQCIEEAAQGLRTYNASLYLPPRRRDIEQLEEIRTHRNLFLLSCLFSVPVVLLMVLPMLPPYGEWLDYMVYNMLTVGMLLKWILCTPVQFIVGWRFYVGSYYALRQKSANMDVLVALGTNAAYFYSVYIVIKAFASKYFQGEDFFETSAMLISFILLGKYLEVIAKGKTSDALAKLARLAPDTSCLLTLDDNNNILAEVEIDTQMLQRNDVIKIVPGAKVPVDGIVIHGQSHVNESTITGESRPTIKKPGDKVVSGTVNENGCLFVKATHVGADTTLSQIVQLVESAQLSRASAQKLADQISKFFVPAVVVVAFLTWLGWLICGEAGIYPKHWIPKGMDEFELALQFGISVLVIACPCALGLATPTAVMVASGKGASLGVLIKGASALENAYKVKTVVFDKTGTLTLGRPKVVSVVLFSNFSMAELCHVAMAIESNSKHPLANAVVQHAKKVQQKYGFSAERPGHVENFAVFPGTGVGGKVDSKFLALVGNRRLMRANNIRMGTEVDRYIADNEHKAQTCILVAINGRVAGGFGVNDPPKPGAKAVISYLRSKGISSIMVTGDNRFTAAALARDLGIDDVLSEVDPIGKANKIKALKMTGDIVAMVGDGVNDSPALAASDIGIAIGAGTDIAIEAADIVLMRSNIEDVVTAIDLSRQTTYRIWFNYIWALGYNIIVVPIAAGILYPFTGTRLPPWLAGACMAASSVSVVCSSLLLKCFKRPLNFQSII
ncbi:copper-transporting ATPase HMA4-like [Momordica charantia]|uniref:Copper-transporting ATPase HMA4-like n=1 Tax=Momordica charantia TaxID=3673 RepID=A0A6J1D664_MOMCH|nr:copper-transporting ATPase HMA4-like [Momordica charantia]XP_022148857.1 copper-transporting ATPase HMA4-like [Momordica charantia]